MLVNSLVLAGLAAVASAGLVAPVNRGCGTAAPNSQQLAVSKAMAAKEAEFAASGNFSLQATIEVNVYFHVVASSTSLSGGYITDKMLSDQFAVMNSNYAPHGIHFTLKGTDKTVNSAWASDGNELAMKRALRKGTYSDLNVYFLKSLGGALGYCYFPTSVSSGSEEFYLDGCSILYTSVPGGSATNFNLGKTVTHEVGHWFGLFHTFQGGCSTTNDGVSDTPAQSGPTSGCPAGRDSCSGGGVDPIHNYMDYSYDSCYDNFTPGQQTRIYSYWNQYRA